MMKRVMALVTIAVMATLFLAACTTVEVAAPTETPMAADATGDISALEQMWIDNWIEDGSAVSEARCIWDVMMDFYGSEREYAIRIGDMTDSERSDDVDAMFVDSLACWE